MTEWEAKIARVFTDRFVKAPFTMIRLRAQSIFPDFESAAPDEKESFLEAAESLEKKGLIQVNWTKRGKGERIKTVSCENIGKLFEFVGGKNPVIEHLKIKRMIKARNSGNEFFNFITENLNCSDLGFRIDVNAARDFMTLIENNDADRNITLRALSVELYNNSKRLENILELFRPLIARAKKAGVAVPDLSIYIRSFPEILLAGKLVFEYKGKAAPLVNSKGSILSFPLCTVMELSEVRTISTIDAKTIPAVLTIENKETFYAVSHDMLAGNLPAYHCVVYSGGYPSDACAAFLRLLAASSWRFFHAGDLDPTGILILQHITDIVREAAAPDADGGSPAAPAPVTPVFMNEQVFNQYLPHARSLPPASLKEAEKIRADIRSIPGIAELLQRIEETHRGVEQEIISWRK